MARIDPTAAERLVAAALAHAARGLRVFPVVPGGKRPAVKDWEARATTEPDRIRRCWAAGSYNIGIACGPSQLLVVDLDRPKPDAGGQPAAPRPPAWQLPGVEDGADVLATLAGRAGRPGPWDTYAVTTPSGGLHLYFDQPPGKPLRNTAGRLGWLIDTRGHGGYVVAAGSITDAGRYRTLNPVEPVTLPIWLLHALTAPEPDHSTSRDDAASAASIVADVRR